MRIKNIIRNFLLLPLGQGLLFFLPLGQGLLFSQNKEKEIIAVSAGAGILTFHGDVGGKSLVGAYSFIRSGLSFSIEKYFNKNFALSFSGLRGKISREETASDNLPKLNFDSFIAQAGLNATFLMAGKRNYPIIPFFSAGISFLSFDPHGDLDDKNWNTYYYWKDGSIRDLPETPTTFYAQTLNRDYTYETKLNDSAKYSEHTLVLPLGAGIKLKLTPHVDANIGFTYHIAFSDYLDNVKARSSDKYLFSSVSLTFHIFSLLKKEREEKSQLFADMDKMDSDKDGIPDSEDLCPDTPVDVKTDGKGCPIDSDADGVPDYLDKEPKSKNGLPVDVNGVELTKERLVQMQKEQNAEAELHSRAYISEEFNKKPSAAFMKEIEDMALEMKKKSSATTNTNPIPYDLRVADWNKDNFISSEEIAKTIDAFFDGTITFNAEQIHRLIDFFFEQ